MSKTTKKDCMSNHLLLMKLILFFVVICLFTAGSCLYCEKWSIVWCMVEVRDLKKLD